MPKEIITASLNKKKKQTKRQKLSSTKEKKTSVDVMESMEKTITDNASKGKHNTLDESTLNPKAKALLEELSSELGVSKEVIAELAITLYRFYKDKQ